MFTGEDAVDEFHHQLLCTSAFLFNCVSGYTMLKDDSIVHGGGPVFFYPDVVNYDNRGCTNAKVTVWSSWN